MRRAGRGDERIPCRGGREEGGGGGLTSLGFVCRCPSSVQQSLDLSPISGMQLSRTARRDTAIPPARAYSRPPGIKKAIVLPFSSISSTRESTEPSESLQGAFVCGCVRLCERTERRTGDIALPCSPPTL